MTLSTNANSNTIQKGKPWHALDLPATKGSRQYDSQEGRWGSHRHDSLSCRDVSIRGSDSEAVFDERASLTRRTKVNRSVTERGERGKRVGLFRIEISKWNEEDPSVLHVNNIWRRVLRGFGLISLLYALRFTVPTTPHNRPPQNYFLKKTPKRKVKFKK